MRLNAPRITPIAPEDLTAEQREALGSLADGRRILNIFATMARAPKALARFLEWGNYVLSRRNSLSARQREIVILRVGFLCRSGYEFTQHTRIGLESGLTKDEIAAIKAGPEAGWSAADAALIRAADELVGDHFISDGTWARLRAHFDEKQCMDVVFTVGQYTQVSMLLNTFGVQLDEGQTLDPDLRA
jgi:alkylhydroperoxidase family enzyme